ncbi:MAG TPA: gamma-glutamylcyclotransferase family protein [Thermoanaerobaculia bacterium]|nr:gamma-glutamylcyclotransferase family protein [Thermoanaerobaculia bacterium]
MPLYFAYGSNLSSARMALPGRAPLASPVGTAALAGYTLRWCKRGADGSGKCTLVKTGSPADGVWGVVWEVAAEDVARLDVVEGPGYERLELQVTTANQRLDVFTYVARSSHVDPSLEPAEWYRALVLAGAREHGLPAAWIAFLESAARTARSTASESNAPPPPRAPWYRDATP